MHCAHTQWGGSFKCKAPVCSQQQDQVHSATHTIRLWRSPPLACEGTRIVCVSDRQADWMMSIRTRRQNFHLDHSLTHSITYCARTYSINWSSFSSSSSRRSGDRSCVSDLFMSSSIDLLCVCVFESIKYVICLTIDLRFSECQFIFRFAERARARLTRQSFDRSLWIVMWSHDQWSVITHSHTQSFTYLWLISSLCSSVA